MNDVLILKGDGLNSEIETKFAFEEVGLKTQLIDVGDLINRPSILQEFRVFVIPGGFSYADELGGGKILAKKLEKGLGRELLNFSKNTDNLLLGICNGFQVFLHLNLFELPVKSCLTYNSHFKFENRDVKLNSSKSSSSPWLTYLKDKDIKWVIRNGEGRFEVDSQINLDDYIAFKYSENINGSFSNIAGIHDISGRVLGLMPHPECNIFDFNSFKKDTGYFLFKGAQSFIRGELNG